MKNCLYCGKKLTGLKRKFCSNKHKNKFHNEYKSVEKYSNNWNFDSMDGNFSNEDN